MAGNNANPGTQAAPKRDLSGINLSTLPAGTTLLFKRGGAWSMSQQVVVNPNVTASAPLTLADYGSGALPLLRIASGNTFQFGRWNDTSNDGGYVLRNLKLDGMGTAQWGLFFGDNVHDVVIDGLEITGFGIGIHVESNALPGTVGLTVRNSNIHHNIEQGILAKAHNATYENNLFQANNPSGSNRYHGMYLSGGDHITVRGNRFIRNSVTSDGVCDGGNMTIHGQVDGMLIEDNLIEQDRANGGCFGISITPGYLEAEWFRNVTVRGNTVVNVGFCSICAGSAPGIVIENNKLISLQNIYQAAVQVPANGGGVAPDALNGTATVTNNTICQAYALAGSGIVAPIGSTVTGNILRTGAEASAGGCSR